MSDASASKREALAAKRAELQARVGGRSLGQELVQSERALERGTSALQSDVSRDMPSGASLSNRSAASDASTASKRAVLEAKRQELLSRGGMVTPTPLAGSTPPPRKAPQAVVEPLAPGASSMARDMSALKSDVTKQAPSDRGSDVSDASIAASVAEKRAELARRRAAMQAGAGIAQPPPTSPAPPTAVAMARGTQALVSAVSEESPSGESERASQSTADSTASKRAALEERRRIIAARKAGRAPGADPDVEA